ncbi:hypothetical protein G7K_3439-t1 [Saitoella complicata NRRL Y-17804]|uniref:Translin n=2 Tax=Saitoella complicata (strain BCRC 22490 / CBS 7301 / JCM 7358 / NBRC 10748 / NRRL Y-17804) TaxID=698492 RepID=A0A0E9NHC6_SAICN|nr:hypothetical protein G7K_3439-t1 [Saitoella complicata NRRL Y-17804]
METTAGSNRAEQLIKTFEAFRDQLDSHNERRERIIKISRDVTALAKKMIFSLHRLPPPSGTSSQVIPSGIQKDLDKRNSEIHELLRKAAVDLEGPNAYKYQKQLSGALQEYLEALTFQHYLETSTLLTYPAACALLSPLGITLPESDFLLGWADTTGELMRRAISLLPAHPDSAREILVVLRGLWEGFECLNVDTEGVRGTWGEIGKKMGVMRGSVQKVEDALYSVCVRGSERPAGMLDLGGGGGGNKRQREVDDYVDNY